MNPYFSDAGKFFRFVSINIKPKLDNFEVINLTLNFALGVERILKGILYDVNPIYILEESNFKNSLPVYYSSKMLDGSNQSSEISDSPNENVITFRKSLLWAKHLSKVCFEHYNLLFNISNARDIIAHHELSKLGDINLLRTILQRDFYTFIDAITQEQGINSGFYFDGSKIKLSKLSSSLQTDLNKKVKLQLETHLEIWNNMKGNQGYQEDKDKETIDILRHKNKEKIECPSCKNNAVLFLNPIKEFNVYEKRDVTIGFEISKLKCKYCKLEIKDAATLDHLKIRSITIEDFINGDDDNSDDE